MEALIELAEETGCVKNVVFIVTDSLRKDRIGVYNSEVDFTENIDSFAEEAAVFEDAVSTSSWTLPSHASFFTGLYPWEHGATQRNLKLEVEGKTLAEKFSEKGYDTYCFSINGFLRPHSGLLRGFDHRKSFQITTSHPLLEKIEYRLVEWLSSEKSWLKAKINRLGDLLFYRLNSEMRETEDIIEEGKNAVEESGENFFVFMNLMDAHEPYYPPEEYREKHGAPEPSEICQNPADFYSGKKKTDFERIKKLYDASVDYMDDRIGEFFEFLREEDEWEDTAVVLVSDHGQMLGEEGHYGHQFSVHEKLVSVPMIAKGPGEKNVKEQVELREIYEILPSWVEMVEKKDPGTEFAKGGYEFPDMMMQRIPGDRKKELYRRHTFVRTSEKKMVKSETEDGKTEWKCIDLETGKKIDRDDELAERMPEFENGGGEKFEDKDEEVKKKLRDLGYG